MVKKNVHAKSTKKIYGKVAKEKNQLL